MTHYNLLKLIFTRVHEKIYIFRRNIHIKHNTRILVIKMVSMTLSIPTKLKKEMELYPEINWSAVAREAIKRKIHILNELDKLLEKSKLTEDDALFFGKKITKKAAKKYREA